MSLKLLKNRTRNTTFISIDFQEIRYNKEREEVNRKSINHTNVDKLGQFVSG